MKEKPCFICVLSKLALILSMYVVGLYFYKDLPNIMPIHWDFSGQADSFARKEYALFLFPLISVVMLPLFSILKRIDPKKEKYVDFRQSWEVIQISIIAFFTYVYFVMIYATLNSAVNVGAFILAGVGVLFTIMGFYMIDVKQNYFIGFKTPWTLSNEKVWDKTQEVGGASFVIAGVMLFLEGFIYEFVVPVFIVAILIAVLVPFVYSYFYYKKISK